MKKWLGIVAVTLALTIVGNGNAYAQALDVQPRQGNNPFERDLDAHMLDDEETLAKSAQNMAACIARRGGDDAGSLIGGTLVKDPGFASLTKVLSGRFSNCRRNAGNATPMAISGALAEQLLVAEAPVLADRATSIDEMAGKLFFGDLSGAVSLDNLVGCLAVHSPGLAYKVLKTVGGTPEEAAAVAALYGQTPECGMTTPPANIPRVYHRGAIATALYAWEHPRL